MPESSSKGLLVIFLLALLVALTSCAVTQHGPFAYPDGIYEGASDFYD